MTVGSDDLGAPMRAKHPALRATPLGNASFAKRAKGDSQTKHYFLSLIWRNNENNLYRRR